MRLRLVSYLLFLTFVTGCSNKPAMIYAAPTNEQITAYVADNHLNVQDSIWVNDSALILMKDTLITLHADQHGKIYEQKISWLGSNEITTVGNGVPYIAIVIPYELMDRGAEFLKVTFSDGRVELRGILDKQGFILSNYSQSKVQEITVLNDKDEEIYSKKH